MNILFIHGNYPAQFRSLLEDLGSQGVHNIYFLTGRKDPDKHPIQGVQTIQYQDKKQENIVFTSRSQAIVHELTSRGERVQSRLIKLAQSGFTPRLIFFHGGNGLGLFLKQIFPNATLIGYFEWYFSNRCAKLILNSSGINSLNYIKARNTSTESEIINCDACVVPTEWQARQFPEKLRQNLTIIFDGVNTEFFKPGSDNIFDRTIQIEGEDDQLTVAAGDKLLSYATRGMEPLRGFPQFMEYLPELLETVPNLKVLIGGRDRSAYGPSCQTHNGSWKEMILDKLPILKNHPRITYTGLMNYENYRLMLQRTNLHVYLTQPYVTSWSLFEAVACGAPILTNQSPATTGILGSISKIQLESIDEISKPRGIALALSKLEAQPHKLPDKIDKAFTLRHAKKEWQTLINQALTNKKS